MSNYFNHHQKSLSDALAKRSNYTFIATASMTEERRAMGWGSEPEPAYVCSYDREPERAEACIAQADVVIAGSAPEKLVKKCVDRGQMVFRYMERPLRHGMEWHKYFPRFIKWHLQNPEGKPIYLLCASAYTAGDFARFGLFRGRAFRWGYFPETKRYGDLGVVLDQKKPVSILWAGRLLDLKHPDDAVRVAAKLKASGMDFEMNIIGRGEMEEALRRMIRGAGLEDQVHLLGFASPEEVRWYMEQSRIFLVTSDRREGWGAVLNEAMNSGCAVVASDAIGAAPYLLRDGENGCVYHSGDVSELYEKVSGLLDSPERVRRLGEMAHKTIVEQWNGETAAERLICLLETLRAGEEVSELYPNGPCSLSPIIGEDWYKE